MVSGNYPGLLEFISSSSGVPIDEIERKIEAKQAKLSGLISKEGAAQVVAAELGVNFEKQKIKISQIMPGMRKVNVVGKIINMFPIREYNKNGRSGRIGSFILADDTSNIRAVLWDENHIGLIAKGEINNNNVVEITNASMKNGEIHLTSFSEIKNSSQLIKTIVTQRLVTHKKIAEFNTNDNASARAFIVNIFEPKFFEICPECRKKVGETKECLAHGKVNPQRRAILNFVIDDGSDSMRAVAFSDHIEKIMGKEELENPELFLLKKKELLGKEMIIGGQIRRNTLFNNNEIIADDFREVDLDSLITELER
jgi:replication factor A1